MEWLTIILSSFLTLLAPAGLVIDKLLADAARNQLDRVEVLAVRVDNVPSYQIIDGKVDRVRLAARGIYPVPGVRIEAVELETDPVDIDLSALRQKNATLSGALRRDAAGAFRVVVRESDINAALRSPEIKARLENIFNGLIPKQEGMAVQSYKLEDAAIEFSPAGTVGVRLKAQPFLEGGVAANHLDLTLEVRVRAVEGRTIELSEPSGTLNGRRLSTRLLKGFTDRLTQELDLRRLEKSGITARILQFGLGDDNLELAGFVRLEKPDGSSSSR